MTFWLTSTRPCEPEADFREGLELGNADPPRRATTPSSAASKGNPAFAYPKVPTDLPLKLVRLLLARLERVSVDSYWAHRASGVRGALLRELEKIEAGSVPDEASLSGLVDQAFRILEQAARADGG